MPINFNSPATTQNYATEFVPGIVENFRALGAMLDPTYAGTVTAPPTGTKRLNAGLFEQWGGSSWAELAVAYAKKAGDTFTGPVALSGAAAQLQFIETDQTMPAGRWRWLADGGTVQLQRNTHATVLFQTATQPIIIAANDTVTFNTTPFVNGSAMWHAGNFVPTDYAARAGSTMTGGLISRESSGIMAVATQGDSTFEVRAAAAAGNAAYMQFHRPGQYAVRFGLDTDNKLKVGGWSLGAVAHEIWHAGTFTPGNYLARAGGTMTGTIAFVNDAWNTSADGAQRFYFANASSTYFRSPTSFYWRNSADADILSMDSGGNLTAAGNITAYSDRRIKTNVSEVKHALARLLNLHGVTFLRTDNGMTGIGLIAQDVEAQFPEAVMKAQDHQGTLSVAYGNLVGPIVEALRELNDRLVALETA